MNVGFVLHPQEPRAQELYRQARSFLGELGAGACVLGDPGRACPTIDAVVSMGGDGTMLRAMAAAWREDVPVLGVNLGQLGYLAEVEPSALEPALQALLDGSIIIEERVVLEARAGARSERTVGFNEVVVERQASGHLIRASVAIDGRPFLRYAADGIIVATPTGSTAYAFSARGPVLSPRVDALVLTPIAPHQLFDRSLVLGLDEPIEIRLLDGPRASVMVDGVPWSSLVPGEAVEVHAATRRVRLAQIGAPPFHEVLKAKFGLEVLDVPC